MFGMATIARPAPVGVPDPPPPPPATEDDPGDRWMHIGDSQTAGRGDGTLTRSDATTFFHIWNANFPGQAVPDTSEYRHRNGSSGRYLYQTHDYYVGSSVKGDRTFVRCQESGGQTSLSSDTQQATPEAFKATVKAFWVEVHATTPAAKKLYQTAYSFGREGDPGRNWDPYNDILRIALQELLSESGITVRLSEVDRNIKKLDADLGSVPDLVWFSKDHPKAYHFTGIGNLMAALSDFHALGYNVAALDCSALLTEISQAHIDACKAVIAFYA